MTRLAERRIRIDSRTARHAVRGLLDAVLAQLADWQIGPETAGNVQIVLAEALNNVVEHAYGFRDGGLFSLEMALEDGRLTCVIRDEGTPFPDGTPPEGDPVALDGPTETLPEGGFGWFMIRALTDKLDYERCADCNILTLVFAAA